jgi:hypothetical protein
MAPPRIRELLARVGCRGDPCDLDILVFFHRHPRAVLTSERLAAYVGYELSRVAKSLDALLAAGLLTREQRPTGSACMYLLVHSGSLGGWLDSLLRLASTRLGRLAVMAALAQPSDVGSPTSDEPAPPVARRRSVKRARAPTATEVRHA